MTHTEAYEKYKHLDQCLSDREWAGDDFKYSIISDLWEAIKTFVETVEANQ